MQKEKLRTARKAKGYTQQQIADLIATDVSNYSRKESGDVKITDKEWAKIAYFLDLGIDDIFEQNTRTARKQPLQNKRSGSSANGQIGDGMSHEVIKRLLEYIAVLKEEINDLKDQI